MTIVTVEHKLSTSRKSESEKMDEYSLYHFYQQYLASQKVSTNKITYTE